MEHPVYCRERDEDSIEYLSGEEVKQQFEQIVSKAVILNNKRRAIGVETATDSYVSMLDTSVVNSEHCSFFSNEINLKQSLFVAYC